MVMHPALNRKNGDRYLSGALQELKMANNVFLISDTHFGHKNICNFLRADGVTKLRPWNSPEEMDEVMVERWNAVVKPGDKVYHLGDVAINRRCLPTMDRLNGRKVLIKGNHDIFKLTDYTKHFYDVRAYHVLDMFIMSHIPLHTANLGRFKGNVHGHMHEHVIDDPRYKSVCVEQVDYTPIAFEVVQQHFQRLSI